MPKNSPLNGLDGQLMVMAAHRYCLGRQTYIVESCIDWLQRWWLEFQPNTQVTILRDIMGALQANTVGSDVDAREWRKLALWIWQRMNKETQAAYKQAAQGKPWLLLMVPEEIYGRRIRTIYKRKKRTIDKKNEH